ASTSCRMERPATDRGAWRPRRVRMVGIARRKRTRQRGATAQPTTYRDALRARWGAGRRGDAVGMVPRPGPRAKSSLPGFAAKPIATPIQIAVRWYGLSSVRLRSTPTNLYVIAEVQFAGCWSAGSAV